MTIHEIIRENRTGRGLTQEMLAEKLNVTPQAKKFYSRTMHHIFE